MPKKSSKSKAGPADDDSGISRADAAQAALGGKAVVTYKDLQYAREKGADTGAKELSDISDYYVELEPVDGKLVPRLCYGKVDVSVAVCTVMNEPVVNISDIHITNTKVNKAWISFDGAEYSVRNNGPGIPVVKRETEGDWVPYACFFLFRTGSHMKQVPGTIAGGTHGKGVKLTIAHAKSGCVKTSDDTNTFECAFAPMENIDEPTIRKKKKSEQGTEVRVKFSEKYLQISKKELHQQVRMHGQTLATYLAITMGKRSTVCVNFDRTDGEFLPITATSFRDILPEAPLIECTATCTYDYLDAEKSAQTYTGKWDIVFDVADRPRADNEPPADARLSLVNGTRTLRGANFEKVLDVIVEDFSKRGKKNEVWKAVKWTPAKKDINPLLGIYMNCRIPDAKWNEQTKTHLMGPACKKFNLKIPAKTLKELYERMEPLLSRKVGGGVRETAKEKKAALARLDDKTKFILAGLLQRGGHKKKSVRKQVYLWVVEGDSAKGLIKRLLTTSGKNRDERFTGATGSIYNLGGVISNVAKSLVARDDGEVVMTGALKKNPKIRPLIDLVTSKTYQGGYVLATDMDIDGGFICCLVLELINWFDPEAFEEGRVLLFATPQARYTPNKKSQPPIEFYSGSSVAAAERGEIDLPKGGRWAYFKGLAALPPQKDYLIQKNLADRLHKITPRDKERFKELRRVYFASKKPEERREQLSQDPPEDARRRYETALENIKKKGSVRAEDFVECVMYEYSYATITRHLSSWMDGFTESMRKIFYGLPQVKSGKNGDYDKIYMGAGRIGSYSNYMHGEASLGDTIMASGAVYPGAGHTIVFTRLDGGGPTRTNGKEDAGSVRYVGMSPNMNLINLVAPPADLVFLDRDEMFGETWEPVLYCPTIPLAVCSNTTGIMFGWAQRCFARDPIAVCEAVLDMIKGKTKSCPELPPALFGFKGEHRTETITKRAGPANERIELRQDITVGRYHYDDKTEALTITEIPVYDSTGPVLTKQMIKGLENTCKDRWEIDLSSDNDRDICIRILMTRKEYEAIGDVVAFFGLEGVHTPSHLNFIDNDGRVTWFRSYEDVVDRWFPLRKKMYQKRVDREQRLAELALLIEENCQRYCDEFKDLKIKNGMALETMEEILRKHKFDRLDPEFLARERGEHAECRTIEELNEGVKGCYKYLLGISALKMTDKTKAARESRMEKLRERIAELDADRKPFRGAKSWRREVTELVEQIKEGQRTRFQYEDYDPDADEK